MSIGPDIHMRRDERGRLLNPVISAAADMARALNNSCNWFTGVPDSVFKRVLPELKPYVAAPGENHALAMCFGARLGGRRPCAIIQNSGLGLCGDVLYGLFHLYRMGTLLVVAWRGELPWEEPQHQLWGARTLEYLGVLDVKVFDFQGLGLSAVTQAAECAFTLNKPAAVLVHRGNLDE